MQGIRGREDQPEFGAARDEDQVGLAVFGVADRVRAASQAVGARIATAVECCNVLPAQGQEYGPIARFHGNSPGHGHLVSVGRPDECDVGDRAQARELLHRLVGGAIFTERDAVVREHVHHVQSHQRGKTDRRAHVVREDQERGAVGDEAPVRRQPVDDGAHGVFADPEMQVPATVAPATAGGAFGVCA